MKAAWRRLRERLSADDAQARSPAAAIGPKGFALLAGVFAVGCLVYGSMQFARPGLVGADAYYHTRIARLMAERGLVFEGGFPWTQASSWREHFADKEFAFHLLLIPFLGRDLTLGPKCLTALLAALVMALIAWMALRQRWPLPWLWPAVLLAAGVLLHLRLNLTRPHLLSICLTVIAAHLMLRRSVWALLLVALAYPLCYTAAHMLPALAAVYALACLLAARPFPWRTLGVVLSGTLLGLAFHPYRSEILHLWYTQNFEVLSNAFDLAGALAVEFQPPDGRLLVDDSGLLLFGTLGVCLGFLLLGRRASLRTIFLFAASGAYLILFLNVRRFVEYWAPFTVLFLASGSADLLEGFDAAAWFRRHRIAASLCLAGGFALLVTQQLRGVTGAQEIIAQDARPRYEIESRWLGALVPAGETVFSCWWVSFPFLFHRAPAQHYLVGLDPTFMTADDPERFRLWVRISTGQEAEPADRILERFGARWVLAEKLEPHKPFLAQARRDRRFWLRFDGPEAAIFVIPPDVLPWAEVLAARGLEGPAAALGPLLSRALKAAWTGRPADTGGAK
ncbi:MAG: hypothetical protein JXR96_00050 [Deltaproteobacteria bacterium]|nr:hypothetical protein [Deltaproteobacteria bacterium]